MLPQSNYTQFPNEILDRLHELEGSELKIVSCIVRHTLGFHRREKQLSISFLSVATGLSRQGVCNATETLLKHGWITKVKHGRSFKYGISIPDTDTPPDSQLVNSVDQSTQLTSQLSCTISGSNSQLSCTSLVNSVDSNKERKETSFKKSEPSHAQSKTHGQSVCGFQNQSIPHPVVQTETYYTNGGINPDRPWELSQRRNDFDEGFLGHIQKYLAKLACFKDRTPTRNDAILWLNKAKFGDEERASNAMLQWEDYQGTGTLETALAAIGREMTRLGISAMLPEEWKARTGKNLVRDLDLSEARGYLTELRRRESPCLA